MITHQHNTLADVVKSNDRIDSTGVDTKKIEKVFSQPAVSKFFENLKINPEKEK